MNPSILLLDLYGGGHHGLYLDVLRAYWAARALPGHLHIAVSEAFIRHHANVARAVEAMPNATLHRLASLPEGASLRTRDARHSEALTHLVEYTRATHATALYWDHVQLSTALRLRFPRPVKLSGLYFRPSFHYGTLGGPPLSWHDRALGLRKKWILRAALQNPHMHTLFCLDPFVVPHVNALVGSERAVFLPDPVAVPDRSPAIQSHPAGARKTLLIFGVLDQRKGIVEVCQALRALSCEEQAQLRLVLAGPIDGPDAPAVQEALAILQKHSAVEVSLDDRFVPDAEIQQLICSSDLVLLTYQHHIGSSNVLVRAAAAGVSVLAAEYGLVGAQVRAHELGLTVDATRPQALGEAFRRWLDDPASVPFDPRRAQAFAHLNTAEACAAVFWDRLLV